MFLTKCTQLPNVLSYIPSWQYNLSNWIIALHLFCPIQPCDIFFSVSSPLIRWALISHICPPLLQFPHSESVTLFCFLLLLLSHLNSARTTSSPLPFTQNICTCIHTHLHTHTCARAHTHTVFTPQPSPTWTAYHTHTHSVSVGVVPDRNKWQLPNYLLTVDVDAAWDALLIFFSLSLSLSHLSIPFSSCSPPLLSLLWWIMHVQELPICIHTSPSETNHLYVPFVCPSLSSSDTIFPPLISCVVENDTLII